jgi:hypothetical protein
MVYDPYGPGVTDADKPIGCLDGVGLIGLVPAQIGVEIAALFEFIELGAAVTRSRRGNSPYFLHARWLRIRSCDDDPCDGVTSPRAASPV